MQAEIKFTDSDENSEYQRHRMQVRLKRLVRVKWDRNSRDFDYLREERAKAQRELHPANYSYYFKQWQAQWLKRMKACLTHVKVERQNNE